MAPFGIPSGIRRLRFAFCAAFVLCRSRFLVFGGLRLRLTHAGIGAMSREEEQRNHGSAGDDPGDGVDVHERGIVVHRREHPENERDAQQA